MYFTTGLRAMPHNEAAQNSAARCALHSHDNDLAVSGACSHPASIQQSSYLPQRWTHRDGHSERRTCANLCTHLPPVAGGPTVRYTKKEGLCLPLHDLHTRRGGLVPTSPPPAHCVLAEGNVPM